MLEYSTIEEHAEFGEDFSAKICENADLMDINAEAVEAFREKWLSKTKYDPEKAALLNRLNTIQPEQLLRDISAVSDNGVTYAAAIVIIS